MMAKAFAIMLGCAVEMLSLLTATRAEPYHHHHRRPLAYGDSPAYWGVERRVRTYSDCCGWRWTLLNPGEASIRQVNPRLRARSDGRLLEDVASPPPQPEVVVVWPDGSSAGPVVPPPYFRWFGARQGHHHARPLNGAAAKGSGGSGSQKRGR